MTTTLQARDPSDERGLSATPGPPPGRAARRPSWFARDPAWPLIALIAGWPLWWILSFNDYAPTVLAIPMAVRLYKWRASGTRTIRVPPGFGVWLLFLVVTVASVATITLTAPGTQASSLSNRMISWAVRTLTYLAATVILLYAGNLTEKELPRRRLAWLLGLLGIYTVVGGIAGTLLPNVQFTSPLAKLVPQRLQAGNGQVQMMLHPATSQVMTFLGYAEGRPSAPFSYTNMWGNALAVLLPWLFVVWWSYGTRRQRRALLVVFGIAIVPVVYSLDRGLWIGLGFIIAYLAVRFAARGKLALLGVVCGSVAIVGVVILASPLHSLIGQRLAHGRSNTGRLSDTILAVKDAESSPLLGYGDTRHAQGSAASITVGKSANCKSCGQSVVGGDGQAQLLLISSGFLGLILYNAFFAYGVWRYRRDLTPYGMAGVLVLTLGFIFMFVYEAVGPPLAFSMLSYALLWKNDRERQLEWLASTKAKRHPAWADPANGHRVIVVGVSA